MLDYQKCCNTKWDSNVRQTGVCIAL